MLYLCLIDERQIPLLQPQQPNQIVTIEDQAAELAKFLDLPLEII